MNNYCGKQVVLNEIGVLLRVLSAMENRYDLSKRGKCTCPFIRLDCNITKTWPLPRICRVAQAFWQPLIDPADPIPKVVESLELILKPFKMR